MEVQQEGVLHLQTNILYIPAKWKLNSILEKAIICMLDDHSWQEFLNLAELLQSSAEALVSDPVHLCKCHQGYPKTKEN